MRGGLRAVLVATLVLAAGSAIASEAPGHVTARSGQLELSLDVPRTEYALGETVEVRMTLRNHGPGAVTLRVAAPWLFDFAVYDDAGEALGTWAGGRAWPMAPPRPLVLAPGGEVTRTLSWDLAVAGEEGRRALPPGRYSLEGFLAGSRDPWGGAGRLGAYPLPLRTPALAVTVRS